MANFIQTIKNWRRMCKAFTTDDESCCNGCPIMALEFDKYGCDAIFSEWADKADWEEVEDVIETWAIENPEPVYPTWEMYLAERMIADMRDGKTHNPQSVEEYMKRTSIPVDTARKLGIEPKEG